MISLANSILSGVSLPDEIEFRNRVVFEPKRMEAAIYSIVAGEKYESFSQEEYERSLASEIIFRNCVRNVLIFLLIF